MNRVRNTLALLCMALLLTACTHTTSKNAPKTLILRLGGEPSVINPVLSTDTTSSSVEGLIFNGLMRVDADLNMVPDLAEKYEVSADHKTYTFTLKPNVKWQDGHPFTAQDVAFTFRTILDPKTGSVRRSDYVVAGKPIEIQVIDDQTIAFHLAKPFAPFLSNMGMGILPEHLLAGKDLRTSTFNRQPVGTGPFKFSRWQVGQFVQVVRNPSYFGPRPHLDQVLLKIIPDYNTALIAFKKGEIHLQDVQPKDLESLIKSVKCTKYTYDTLGYTFMGFNLKKWPFTEPRVRQAIAMAVNKDTLVTHLLQGYGRRADYPDAPASWSYPNDADIARLPYDPAKSQALLHAAGFKKNPQTGIFEKNGRPLKFTLLNSKGQTEREKAAQTLQQFLKNVGIEVQIQTLEWSTLVKRLNAPQDPKDFDAFMMGWSLGVDPDALSIWHSKEYPAGLNFVGYSNPKVDQGLLAGRVEIRQAERKKIYQTTFSQVAADVPYLFLYYSKAIGVASPRLKGLSKPGPAGLLNRIEAVDIE